jgi:hypothetical protein
MNFRSETTNYTKYTQASGLVQRATRFDSDQKWCESSRKEQYVGRTDGLNLIIRSFDRLILRFNPFENQKHLIGFMRRPFLSEYYWKYRLDGLVYARLTPRQLITVFENRMDNKVRCEATLCSTSDSSLSIPVGIQEVEIHRRESEIIHMSVIEVAGTLDNIPLQVQLDIEEAEIHYKLGMISFTEHSLLEYSD